MTNTKQQHRRISLEEKFMNYSTDDLLFGAMYHLATYNPVEKKLYLDKRVLTSHKKEIYNICGLNCRTLKAHLEKLKDNKFIVEDEEQKIYTFPSNYDDKYQLIENDMLWYIVSTSSKQAVRIYTYLLNRFLWKQREGDVYIFTNKELLVALGYSANSENGLAQSIIQNCLERFCREGIFVVENFFDKIINEDGKEIPVPKKRLIHVAKTKMELRTVAC